ncbi:MAG TPA: hypothetical protein VL501_06010 [Pyrinomonadaceae bacterium]|nr:hypothetical protein [Pyrinomonadaceae bacterium]
MGEKTVSRLKKAFRIYRWVSGIVGVMAVGYLLLIMFPQVLMANSVEYRHFRVYSREKLDENTLHPVLDRAEEKLRSSPIYDETVPRRVYLTSSFGMYGLLSPKAWQSFGNSLPFINNMLVSPSDPASDSVYNNRSYHNRRSLSGVIAHEATHLFIRQRYGTVAASLMPAWKNEGYCEYIAGESTIPLDEGVRLWLESPNDDTGYRYSKYHAMIKYLIEKKGVSVDELFTTKLDESAVAAETLASYQ